MQNEQTKKNAAMVGGSLLVGLATGIAAGLFLRSEKGKQLTDEAKQTAKDLQKQLAKKMKQIKQMTKETYADLVEDIVNHYEEKKELAQEEVQKLKEYLLSQWEDIRERLSESSEDEET